MFFLLNSCNILFFNCLEFLGLNCKFWWLISFFNDDVFEINIIVLYFNVFIIGNLKFL